MTNIPTVAHPPVSSESSLALIIATTGTAKNNIRRKNIFEKLMSFNFLSPLIPRSKQIIKKGVGTISALPY